MDIKELDRLASNSSLMPSTLSGFEQAYYIASRGLYQQYHLGVISLEQAKQEKLEVVKVYEHGKLQYDLFISLYTIHEKLISLKNQGFNSVLEWEILDEIEKVMFSC